MGIQEELGREGNLDWSNNHLRTPEEVYLIEISTRMVSVSPFLNAKRGYILNVINRIIN